MGKKNKYAKTVQLASDVETQPAGCSVTTTSSVQDVKQNAPSQPANGNKINGHSAPIKTTQKTTTAMVRGSRGRALTLETNYLKLNLSKMPDYAYHYDVKIEPERPKKFMRPVFEAYTKKIFPGNSLAYDGRSNAYSPVLLCERALGSEIAIEIVDGTRTIPFKVTMKPTEDVKVDLKSLKT